MHVLIRLTVLHLRAHLWSKALLWGCGTVLLAGVLLAALLTATADLWSLGLVLYVVLPLALAGLAAADVAAMRGARLAEALFAAPVARASLLWSAWIANLLVGLLYVAATLPIVMIILSQIGYQPLLAGFVLAGLLNVLVAVTLGTLCGVLLGYHGVLPAVALAVAVDLAWGLALPLGFAAVANPHAPPLLMHLVNFSPTFVVLAALDLYPGVTPTAASRSLLGVLALVVGALALLTWTFTRHQGPLSWRASPLRRVLLAGLALAVLAAPATLAETGFAKDPPPRGHVHAYQNDGLLAAIAPPGAPLREVRFDDFRSSDVAPLPANRVVPRDVVVLVPVPPGEAVRILSVSLESTLPQLDVRAPASGLVATPAGAASLPGGGTGQAFRMPVEVHAEPYAGFRGNSYVVHVNVTYETQAGAVHGSALRTVDAEVPDGVEKILLAGLPAPALLGVLAVRRHRATRGGSP